MRLKSQFSPDSSRRICSSLFPAQQLRIAVALLLVSLLTFGVIPPRVLAQSQGDANSDPEAAFDQKANFLLKQVRRAAIRDRMRAGRGELNERTSEIEQLTRVTSVEQAEDGTVTLDLTVRLANRTDSEIKAAGFDVAARIGDVATVTTSVDKLPNLAALASVRALSAATLRFPSNDKARQFIGVDDAFGNRLVAQRGRGVIVGIVDSGIDFRHLDFTVPGSNGLQTRIKALLDMTTYIDANGDGRDDNWDYFLPGGTTPIGKISYQNDINAALQAGKPDQMADIVKQRDKSGHGTHVTGTAAGNGLGGTVRTHEGMAPEADLVIVKASRQNSDTASFRNTDTINALKFIEKVATDANQSFVINMSLGGHFGPHDGTLDDERAIDNIVNAGAGRAVCVAAGNEGDEAIHASGSLTTGGSAMLTLNAPSSPKSLSLYYPATDRFSVSVTRPDGSSVTSSPVPYNSVVTNQPHVDIYNILDDKDDLDPANDQNLIYLGFKSGSSNLGANWSLTIIGNTVRNGRFDAWTSDGQFTNYADDSRKVSSPGTSRGAITVGAYNSRAYSLVGGASYIAGQYSFFTNPGPTADSRPKPDISAPGAVVVSSRSSDATRLGASRWSSVNSNLRTDLMGTSMATPVVTGSIALMFEANRNLTNDHLKSLLASASNSDSFTRPGWDARFGNGKLNIAAAVAAASNLNPNANAIWGTRFFVRQQYLDFLNREPEPGGWNDWSVYADGCPPGNSQCVTDRRVITSSGFFRSPEFFTTGYFVMRLYKTSFGRDPYYVEFVPDARQLDYGVAGDRLEASKTAFVQQWVNRPEFTSKYPGSLSPTEFVTRLLQTANLQVDAAERQTLLGLTRAQAVSRVADNQAIQGREYNAAFVRMQYFGYLKRDPEPQGFNDWLNYLNAHPNDYATMIWGFIYSREYQSRFGCPL